MSIYDVMLRERVNGVTLYTPQDFDYTFFERLKTVPRPAGNNGGKYKQRYKDGTYSFDIETSRIKKLNQSIMYVWAFAINFDTCVIGRTWADFKLFLTSAARYIADDEKIKIWVHNLSYEFSFLKGIYHFAPDDVFILDGRRVLRCTILNRFEFCCSFIQTNMRLELLTQKYNVTHQKLSGEDFNYNVMRYPWSKIPKSKMPYIVHDVIGLNEAMHARMKEDNDTVYKMPSTSTGYVRRDVKKAMRKFPREWLEELLPDYDTYKLLDEAFRGGDTHASRFYANRVIKNVVSFDRVSSYPDVIMNCLFPMGRWVIFDTPSEKWLNNFLREGKRALLITATFSDIKLKSRAWGDPYIPRHKCREITGGAFDNGRVLSAKRLKMVLTDVDYLILSEQYKYKIEVEEIRYSAYGKLPLEIREATMSYFKGKTELKGVEDKKEQYEKSKNLLNSIYGMMATRPCKQTIDFLIDDENQFHLREDDERELYDRARGRAFLSFAWGCWVTAWARYRLYEGLKIAGVNYVYCDTDSVKFINDEKIRAAFAAYNDERIADSKRNGAHATDKHGITYYMGVYELDGVYNEFKTLGAKKYASNSGGKIKITIAGVNKEKGAKELAALGGLAALRQGTVFRDAGGLEAIYNDHVFVKKKIQGNELIITDNVCLKPSTYTVGLTEEYFRLLCAEQKKEY